MLIIIGPSLSAPCTPTHYIGQNAHSDETYLVTVNRVISTTSDSALPIVATCLKRAPYKSCTEQLVKIIKVRGRLHRSPKKRIFILYNIITIIVAVIREPVIVIPVFRLNLCPLCPGFSVPARPTFNSRALQTPWAQLEGLPEALPDASPRNPRYNSTATNLVLFWCSGRHINYERFFQFLFRWLAFPSIMLVFLVGCSTACWSKDANPRANYLSFRSSCERSRGGNAGFQIAARFVDLCTEPQQTCLLSLPVLRSALLCKQAIDPLEQGQIQLGYKEGARGKKGAHITSWCWW